MRVVGTDDVLLKRIISLLPGDIRIERYRSLAEIGGGHDVPAFTLCYVRSFSQIDRQEIKSYLMHAPRRLVVLCDEAGPREVYRLAATGAALGLVAVETTRSLRDLAKQLPPAAQQLRGPAARLTSGPAATSSPSLVMESFELALKGGDFASPPPLERLPLIGGQPVVLVALDEALGDAVVRFLPEEIRLIRVGDWGEAERNALAPLSIICTTRLTRELARRVARSLRKVPRRTVVLCRRARLSTVYNLTGEVRPFGLLAITTMDEIMNPRQSVLSWYYAGVVLLDWSALRVDLDNCCTVLRQMIEVIERHPFHDWRVDELARRVGVSARTLRRVLVAQVGLSPKKFLTAVRYQLVERFRTENRLRGKELAMLFEFASAKDLNDWRGRVTRSHAIG